MTDFVLRGNHLEAVSGRARERVKNWRFGSSAFDLEHKYGQPLQEPAYSFSASKEFIDRITEGMVVA